MIVFKRYLVFIVVNQREGTISREQIELQLLLSYLSPLNKSLQFYVIKNLNDCKNLIELLITKKL